jgi:hypothetical protein
MAGIATSAVVTSVVGVSPHEQHRQAAEKQQRDDCNQEPRICIHDPSPYVAVTAMAVTARGSLHVRTIEHHPAYSAGKRDEGQRQYSERDGAEREPLAVRRRYIVESRHV